MLNWEEIKRRNEFGFYDDAIKRKEEEKMKKKTLQLNTQQLQALLRGDSIEIYYIPETKPFDFSKSPLQALDNQPEIVSFDLMLTPEAQTNYMNEVVFKPKESFTKHTITDIDINEAFQAQSFVQNVIRRLVEDQNNA